MNNIKTILAIDFVLLIFITTQYILFLFLKDFLFTLLQIELLLLTVWVIFTCYRVSRNWFSLEIMFVGTIILFLLSRIFLNLFFPETYPAYGEWQWREGFSFSVHTMLEMKFILLYALIFLHIGIFLGYINYKIYDKNDIKYSKIFNLKISYMLFMLGAVAYLYKVYFYFNILNNYGYFAIYSGNFTLPIFVRIFDDFFYLGYFMIIINKPSKRVAYSLSIFFILMYSSYILTGMRAEFLLILLTTIWLLAFLYDWKIKLRHLLFMVFIVVFFSQLTAYIKYSMSLEDVDISFATGFFYAQGVTLLVLGYIVEFNDFFINSITDGVRHIISPFTSKFLLFTGQSGPKSSEGVEEVYSIADRLTYFLNPDIYLAGGGTGSSYIVELYTLGGSIVLLGVFSIILGIAIVYISQRLVYKQYGLFIATIIVPAIFWMPRSAYVYGIQKFIFAWILILSLTFIYQLIKKKKRKKNNENNI